MFIGLRVEDSVFCVQGCGWRFFFLFIGFRVEGSVFCAGEGGGGLGYQGLFGFRASKP